MPDNLRIIISSMTRPRMPICLPYGDLFPDVRGEVFVAGWGSSEDMMCTTNNHGPMKHSRQGCQIVVNAPKLKSSSRCKFPFRYGTMNFEQCVVTPSPSHLSSLCRSLKDSGVVESVPEEGDDMVKIRDKKENTTLGDCFNMVKGKVLRSRA